MQAISQRPDVLVLIVKMYHIDPTKFLPQKFQKSKIISNLVARHETILRRRTRMGHEPALCVRTRCKPGNHNPIWIGVFVGNEFAFVRKNRILPKIVDIARRAGCRHVEAFAVFKICRILLCMAKFISVNSAVIPQELIPRPQGIMG